MKLATTRHNQLQVVEKWLGTARPHIASGEADYGTFALLVAVEQLVEYLRLLEEGK